MKKIYLDNAAATPIDSFIAREMGRISTEFYGNPSSFNDKGREARQLLDSCRQNVARFLKAKKEEIIFTSSGSEANNLAILGLAGSMDRGGEILVNPTEHPSVLNPVNSLIDSKVKYLKVDSDGRVDLQDFASKLNKRTKLVSVMYANNEIGTIQPVSQISKAIKEFRKKNNTLFPLLHVDACQAAGYLNMNAETIGADLMVFNGSKIYGPKGSGALYVKSGVNLRPLIFGGEQERGLRAGTESLAAMCGLSLAIERISQKEADKLSDLRDYFTDKIFKAFPDSRLNGPKKDRLPNNVNISFKGMDSENILIELDKKGIYAGSGSACTSRSVEPSHVLKAIGVEKEYINGAIRFSIGKDTKKSDLDYVVKALSEIIPKLRKRYKK